MTQQQLHGKVVATALVIGFMVSLVPTAVRAANEFDCIGCTSGCATVGKTEITNLKTPDIIILSVDTPTRRNVLGEKFPGVPIVTGTMRSVIASVRATYVAQNRSIHVLLQGHGAPGRQGVGTDAIIGDTGAELDSQNVFVSLLGPDPANGNRPRLANLQMTGCSVGKDNIGLGFLNKMSSQLGMAVPIKAWQGPVEWQDGGAGNRHISAYGAKRDVPALSPWAMIALSLLLLSGGLWYTSRRSQVA